MSEDQVSFGEFWDGVLTNEAIDSLPAHATLSHRTVALAETLLESDAVVTVPPPPRDESPEVAQTERPPGAPESDLELLSLIGQGGMGVVHKARQRSLDRDVAVKSVHPNAPADLVDALLAEARVTGSLEHPNVIPIHSLVGAAHEPMLVMKRVEGHTWSELLANPDHPHWEQTDRWSNDRLRNNLDILLEVCDAVHFAHSRGTLHRDLKPDNVMVGSFGEVYVMDWGLAAPASLETYTPGGSPPYMAPEMLDGLATEQTDVYLLGSILHELLTGTRRHSGRSRFRILLSVLNSEPVDYDPELPLELTEICNRATHPDTDARFPSVIAFRRAITDFLQHRGSVGLAEVATELLTELRRDLKGPPEPEDADRRFAECRFGFRQALRDWPENVAAKRGLRECLDTLTEFELARGNGQAAAATLRERRALDPEPRDQLDALQAQIDARRRETAQLQRLATDLDPSVSSKARKTFFLVIVAIMCPFMIVMFLLLSNNMIERGSAILVALPVLGALIFGTTFIVGRRTLLANVFNRRIMFTFMALIGGVFLHRLVTSNLGHTFEQILTADLVVGATVAAVAGVTITRWLFLPGALLATGAVCASLVPDHALPILVSTVGVSALTGGTLLFRLSPPDRQA